MLSLLTRRASPLVLRRRSNITANCRANATSQNNAQMWLQIRNTARSWTILPDEEQWKDVSIRRLNASAKTFDTYSSRRIIVSEKDGGLARAFYDLSRRIRQENVLKDFKYQQRHEKKGEKRRRLQSERWRRQFANVVRKKVQLVHAIRRRGA